MILMPADLLSGPRGRRLCLEVALDGRNGDSETADALRDAVFHAAYDLDPGRGTSRVLFGLSGKGAGRDAPPRPSPDDVARLLDTVPLAEPGERTLLLALAAAVDTARYWQEPDGEDVLVSSPRVRTSLGRVAAAIAASTSAAGWVEPMDTREQWAVGFPGTTGAGPPSPTTARDTLAEWHAQQVDEETLAGRERPTNPQAMWSGTWWSRPPAGLTSTTRSMRGRGAVGLWLVEDGLGWDSARAERVHVPRDARIHEIDGPDAWAELCRRYPLEVTASRRHDWYRTTGRNGRWVIPDWLRVRHDFDAIHLSVGGYLAAAGSAIFVDDDRATVLAGWDPDKTYWLRDVTRDSSTGQEWRYDGTAETWQLSNPRLRR